MKTMVRIFRFGRRLATMAGLALALSCSPVFIPLPPPGPPTFAPLTAKDAQNRSLWLASGDPQSTAASARYYIWNKTIKLGVEVEANTDGSYSVSNLVGEETNNIELYYVTPTGEPSQVLCVKLATGKATQPCD